MRSAVVTSPSVNWPGPPPSGSRPRVLFFGEAVTLAHVARPVALMRALDRAEFDVGFACDRRFDRLLPDLGVPRREISTMPSAEFTRRLAQGAGLYDTASLRAAVREDLRVFEEFRPDLVVGDFRMSLVISAQAARVKSMAISNSYWRPGMARSFPMPELPLTRTVGVGLARPMFRLASRFVMAGQTIPFNRVRREYGLPSLGNDLRRIYTHADCTLYADLPEPVLDAAVPGREVFLGAVLWSPAVALPAWWGDVPDDRPIIYLTLGSSGAGALAKKAITGLAQLPVNIMCATLGQVNPRDLSQNVFASDYLPGEAAASRASLVVCNGGSPTTQQALCAGVPVIGIASNMDQHLNMERIAAAGAGLLLRSEWADAASILQAARRVISEPAFKRQALAAASVYQEYDPLAIFAAEVRRIAGQCTLQRERRLAPLATSQGA